MVKTVVPFLMLAVLCCFRTRQSLAQSRPTAANAAPQDRPCEEADTQLEMSQYSAERYRKADAGLNALYPRLVRTFQNDLATTTNTEDLQQKGYEERSLGTLRQSERTSIQYRDLRCDAARQRAEESNVSSIDWSACIEKEAPH